MKCSALADLHLLCLHFVTAVEIFMSSLSEMKYFNMNKKRLCRHRLNNDQELFLLIRITQAYLITQKKTI